MRLFALEPSRDGCAELRLRTRSGLRLRLHPTDPVDAAVLGVSLASASARYTGWHFLAEREEAGAAPMAISEGAPPRVAEHILALDDVTGHPVASLLIAPVAGTDTAEMAIVVSPSARHDGVGWVLLKHAAQIAEERGFTRLRALDSLASHETREIERALGSNGWPSARVGEPELESSHV